MKLDWYQKANAGLIVLVLLIGGLIDATNEKARIKAMWKPQPVAAQSDGALQAKADGLLAQAQDLAVAVEQAEETDYRNGFDAGLTHFDTTVPKRERAFLRGLNEIRGRHQLKPYANLDEAFKEAIKAAAQ